MTQIKVGDRVRIKKCGIVVTVVNECTRYPYEWECKDEDGSAYFLKSDEIELLTDPELKPGMSWEQPSFDEIWPAPDVQSPDQVDVKEQRALLDRLIVAGFQGLMSDPTITNMDKIPELVLKAAKAMLDLRNQNLIK